MKRGLVVLLVVVSLFISVSFVSAGLLDWFKDVFDDKSITGKVTLEGECTDSDGGEDYDTKGFVNSTNNGTVWDYCSGDGVYEMYCSGISETSGIVIIGWSNCDNGCSDGACDQAVTGSCTDSDGGKDYDTKGYGNSTINGTKWDYCAGDIVIEIFCASATSLAWDSEGYICPNGCSDGACVQNETGSCTDSDGGKDYAVKGFANSTSNGTKWDYCAGDLLIEIYCSSTITSEWSYDSSNTCANGCSDGKCIANTTTTSTSGSSSTSGGGSGGGGDVVVYSPPTNYDTKTTITDEEFGEVEIENKEETRGTEIKKEEKKTYVDENGNKVTIITIIIIDTNKGEEEREVKRTIETEDGTEITFKTKTEIEDGNERVREFIEVEGAEVLSNLEIRTDNENGRFKIKVILSTGDEQDLITQPDEALQTALNELGTTNNLIFELNEINEDGKIKAVFSVKVEKPGRIFGIFNINIDLETLVDMETGDIIDTKKPWWGFLVFGNDKATVCHVSGDDEKVNLDISISAVKSHLGHGDSIGECVEEVEETEEELDKCIDSDGGENYYTKGYVNSTLNGTVWDYCSGGGVVEMYCSGISETSGIVIIGWSNCDNGCSDGACKTNELVTCNSNSDCGENYYLGDYTCNATGVIQEYVNYVCDYPGTNGSYCKINQSPQLIDKCEANEECIEDKSSCQLKINGSATNSS